MVSEEYKKTKGRTKVVSDKLGIRTSHVFNPI